MPKTRMALNCGVIEQRFTAFINGNQLFGRSDKLLVAVSGGMDSMALAHLLKSTGFHFSAAHVNFGLRGDESDGDENFVREYCEKHSISFFTKKIDVETYCRDNGGGIQESARKLRYQWFEELKKEHGFDCLLTAHHRDDHVETILLNLARGANLKGLAGMRPRRAYIARPMLCMDREDIAYYAETKGILYREDSSNLKDHYRRNYLRHHVIPELKKLNPSLTETVFDHSRLLAGYIEQLEKMMAAAESEICEANGDTIYIDIQKVMSCPSPPAMLHFILEKYGFSNATVERALMSWNQSPGKKFFSHHYELLKDRESWALRERRDSADETEELDRESHFFRAGGKIYQIRICAASSISDPVQKGTLQMDISKLRFPVILRKWEKGDRFRPLGMKGTKLVSDFLTDMKMSRFEKAEQTVLESDGKIAGLPGLRISEDYKVDSSTEMLWRIEPATLI